MRISARISRVTNIIANEFSFITTSSVYYHNAEIKRACRRDIRYQPSHLSIIITHRAYVFTHTASVARITS